MKKYLPILEQCSLFTGIKSEEIISMLGCLEARTVVYAKGTAIFREGDPAAFIGIVLSGAVQIVQDDYYGNRTILGRAGPAELFSESFACSGIATMPVSVIAVQDCHILLMDCNRITRSCTNACEFHNQMIMNLMQTMARKNLNFHQKLEILAKRTTRDKLMAYLLSQAKLHGSNTFRIPFDRQELADYLGVERSAMSAQLGKLRDDGILICDRNQFTLLQSDI